MIKPTWGCLTTLQKNSGLLPLSQGLQGLQTWAWTKSKRSPLTLTTAKPSRAPQGAPRCTCWHQWPCNVGINDNLINNIPLCHWWKHYNSSWEHIPLIHKFSPPLASMEKGTSFDHTAPPVINFSSFPTFLHVCINGS